MQSLLMTFRRKHSQEMHSNRTNISDLSTKSSTALPSPWNEADIPTPTALRLASALHKLPGELRRRKYVARKGNHLQFPLQCWAPLSHRMRLACTRLLGSRAGREATGQCSALGSRGARIEKGTVVIEGPLQQLVFWGFWRWRWCVLVRMCRRWELQIYDNEIVFLDALLGAPNQPLQRHAVASLTVDQDAHEPGLLICVDSSRKVRTLLRTGKGRGFEERVASELWASYLSGASSSDAYEYES